MKSLKTAAIIIILFSFLFSAFGVNAGAQNIDIPLTDNYNEDKRNFSVSETLSSTSLQAVGNELKVRIPFIIVPLHSNATFFSSIKSFLFVNTKVTVLGYEGDYTKVKVKNSETEGYIFRQFLSKDNSLLIKTYSNIWVGKSKSILKDYDNPKDFTWSVSQDGIISVDKKTGTVVALNSGTVKVTAKYNGKTNVCVVTSINPWKETETSVAEKNLTLKATPQSSEPSSTGTIDKGSKIIAHGDMADGNGWIYVSDKDKKIWGFIKLSDFPGIDYLFTEYHYFDKGYDIRFKGVNNKSASDNIYAYASVMNDVMMDLFKLKISPYVYAYTSPADQCKIWRDGSVSSDNLASSCPKTGKHDSRSCLTTSSLRNALYDNGAGNDLAAKAVWTGHIMDGHASSNSQRNPTYILVFTTGNTVDKSTNKNKSDYMVRSRSIYELLHETGHQFDLHDHYCKHDGSPCSNNYCYSCTRGYAAPRCIMNLPFDTGNYDNEDLFCSECMSEIKKHLNDHH